MQQAQFPVHNLDIYMEIAQNIVAYICLSLAYNEYFLHRLANAAKILFRFVSAVANCRNSFREKRLISANRCAILMKQCLSERRLTVRPIHILIADDNDDFRINLHDALSPYYIVRCCQTGKEIMAQINTLKPDILVMDLLLRELDGISALNQISQLPQPPAILVVTTFISDYVEQVLSEMGIRDLMRKPCDLNAAVSRVRSMANQYIPPISAREELITGRLLAQMNIAAHMEGCSQLKAAIPLFARDPAKPLNKVIYAEAAKLCGHDNPKQVERSIRNAIDKAWSNPCVETHALFFPQGKPN
jgi:two-component system response regulator (stage 0 sporulation protein A)